MRQLFLACCGFFALAHAALGAGVTLEPVASGLTAPIQVDEPDDGSGRRLIAQQNGIVKVLDRDGNLKPEPFLDLSARMIPLQNDFEERGLLGFALHPDFARNGRVFASYSAPLRSDAPRGWNHTRRVSEFSTVPGDLSKVDPASERVLLQVDWPSRKHNGGGLAFGPDGNLYIGLGDGGASHGVGKDVVWDAFNVPAEALMWDRVAQDTHSPFGKILRIDVDRGFPGYAIPADNPFASGGAASGQGMPEVWAWGFRNPFRLAFDDAGQLFATATAETLWESAYHVKSPGNYGWPLLEATHCIDRLHPRQPPADCDRKDQSGRVLELPVIEYPNMQVSHADTNIGLAGVGTAITGARMYDGRKISQLRGKLLVSDWSADFKQPSGQLFAADPNVGDGEIWPLEKLLQSDTRIIGLSADRSGEIYVLTNETMGPYGSTGKVWRLVSASE